MASKFRKGKQILTMADFENCDSYWYIIYFDGLHPSTRHRGYLESLQYHTLSLYIYKGAVFVAEPKEVIK